VAVLWIPLLLLTIAAAFDMKDREIPDWIPLSMLGWVMTATVLGISPYGWLLSALGLAVGLAFGALVFWLGGFGGGDAKLLAALGATLGPRDFALFMFDLAIVGGVFALAALLSGRRDVTYAPVMVLGFVVFLASRSL
jgi:Flp pilus assembly protein protease CpaA